jgi:hypothetical protein
MRVTVSDRIAILCTMYTSSTLYTLSTFIELIFKLSIVHVHKEVAGERGGKEAKGARSNATMYGSASPTLYGWF